MLEMAKLLAASDEEILAASGTTGVDFGVDFESPIVVANTEEAG